MLYCDGKIYFHSAKSGHKIDAIKKQQQGILLCNRPGQDRPGRIHLHFRSVIVFGNARFIEDDAEKRKAIEILGEEIRA